MIGHAGPEAAVGGPIAAIRDRDVMDIDLEKFELNERLSDAALMSRMTDWPPPSPPRYRRGILGTYVKLVKPTA